MQVKLFDFNRNKKDFIITLKIINISDNSMRGIQINNYFNNHITLNGKKISQDPQNIAQTSRQKLAYGATSNPDDLNPPQCKASPIKHQPTPLKKRTNTLVELKKHLPLKRSISVQRQRNAASAKKKEEVLSDSEEKQEQPLINMSQKKFKPHASKGGLGKRSKSTIIKAHEPHQKEFLKKESKKLNSNPTSESTKPLKSKRKKSSKISEVGKDNKHTITTKHSTARKEPPISKQIFKKEKLTLKIDKNIIKADKNQKKSARNHNKNIINPTTKSSKPVSARQKKVKKNRFIQQLKEKYENQTILQDHLGSSRLKDNQENKDQLQSVMSSLQKFLTSVGSKQKLKKELEIINEKLRQFKLETQEEDQQRVKEDFSSNNISSKIEQIGIESLENDLIRGNIGRRAMVNEEDDQSEQEQSESDEEEPLPHKLSQEDEILMRLQGEEVKNPLIGKRNNNIFFIQEKNDEQPDDRKRQIELLKRFKNQSTKMMEKAGLVNDTTNVNTQKLDIQEQPQPERKLTLDNVSGLSNGSNGSMGSSNSHKWEDKYPSILPTRSPRFDEAQLLGAIELKEQFLSSKRDKMSELVKRMFEKQLVSPRSYEFQMKSLDHRYQQENQQLQAMRKQAEQLSSMLSQIKKDKEEIQGIDELIRNEKWQEAQRLVQKAEKPLPSIAQHQEHQKKWQLSNERPASHERPRWELSGWEKEGGWERVKIEKGEVEGNQFVETGELTNRARRIAEAQIDIDQECGGTEESQELQPHEVRPDHQDEDEEYIYYQEDNEEEKKSLDSGLIRLVQIPQESAEENSGVFHIREQEGIQRSNSILSAPSQPERGGFVTNLYFIKEYCIAICEFVRDNDTFKAQFRQNISRPLQFELPVLLSNFREEESAYFYSRRTYRPAIPAVIWDEFNSQYETLKLHSTSANKQSEKYRLEKELELVFVRMIYEVLNESLDHERPGGQFGRALPWRETARHLKNLKQLGSNADGENIQAYDLMFGVAIARIIQWGSCLCGFLPDTVQLENTDIDQAYVNHIRETRTAFLLEKMMAEEEAVMTNFELEETQVQYSLGQLIYQELLEEAQVELSRIF